jgi:3-hydroxyisobutyrate dehydrogenase-like beta-hydroxyacid dehydrogenase
MSTVPPTTIEGLAGLVRATGAGILDAPVSGSVALAERGELTIMVGGDAADLERARPVFEALAGRIFHLGPLGSGATMKLAVNAVIFGLNQAVAEALILAERSGIERGLAYDVLAASAAGAPYVGYKRAAFVDPDATPAAFSLALARKDLELIAGLAERVGAPMTQSRLNLETIRAAAIDDGDDADLAAVAGHLRTVRTR